MPVGRNTVKGAVSVIRAQEQERQRIAREIHDGPLQRFVSVMMMLDIYERVAALDEERASKELARIRDALRRGVSDMRQLLNDLKPLALEESGLGVSLSDYVDEFAQQTGINATFVAVAKVDRLAPDIEIAAYRVIQECLSNALKHAAANRLKVTMGVVDGALELDVKDDGKGFDPSAIELSRSDDDHAVSGRFGLRGMKERVRSLGGTMEVSSRPGRGTKISVRIPV